MGWGDLGKQQLDRHPKAFCELGPRKSLKGNEPPENSLSPGHQEPKGRSGSGRGRNRLWGARVFEPQMRAYAGLIGSRRITMRPVLSTVSLEGTRVAPCFVLFKIVVIHTV